MSKYTPREQVLLSTLDAVNDPKVDMTSITPHGFVTRIGGTSLVVIDTWGRQTPAAEAVKAAGRDIADVYCQIRTGCLGSGALAWMRGQCVNALRNHFQHLILAP